MLQRRKLRDEIVDEDGCPKRKIIKLDLPTASDLLFNNDSIVRKIIGHVIGEQSIFDNLSLRLVSKTFDEAAKSVARIEYRQITVSPYVPQFDENGVPDEPEFDDEDCDQLNDRSFLLNDRRIRFSQCANISRFLCMLGNIRIRDVTFSGYAQPDERIHNFVLLVLLGNRGNHLHSFMGAEEVCPGCSMCTVIATSAKVYGPVQFSLLTDTLLGERHFDQLIITEILFHQIALHCVENVDSKSGAMARLRKLITPQITCDRLDIVFSDRCMWSKDTVSHPREVVDCILATWKCTKVCVQFMTDYSSVDSAQWASKGLFTECRLDQKYADVSKRRERFARVEVDMQAGDEIATCFAESMGLFERGGMSATAFQNVCVNCRRLFPTQDMFFLLPHELARVAHEEFDNFCKALLEFAWKDELTARHSRLYFRLFTYGLTESDVMKQIKQSFVVNRRSIIVEESSESTRITFHRWLPGTTTNFERFLLSFADVDNNCWVHLEVCIEPA